MKILVINCGSSSLKFQLLDMETEELICKGTYERIGEASFLKFKMNGEEQKLEHPAKDHSEALEFSIETILKNKAVESLDEVSAIGHRTPHGGERFTESVLITDEVFKAIGDVVDLAPLHIPACLKGIEACKTLMPGKPNVAVFDTSFHHTISKEKYIYPIPYEYYEKYKIRKYGFHGTSHRYVANRIAEIMGRDDLKVINCHIGQGASIAAIDSGKSVETSMGMTPTAGIPMGTRSGTIDPSIVTFIMKNEGLGPDEMDAILNKKSGKLGVSGLSNDDRDLEKAAEEGNKRAKLAVDIFAYKVAQTIAEYMVSLGGCDVITLTAGIGENQVPVRRKIFKYLEFLGLKPNEETITVRGEDIKISAEDSSIPVWVVPTNEELLIARDTKDIVTKM